MIELLQQWKEAGSFAAVWFTTWFLLFALLWLLYPLVRRVLMTWHPAMASNALLLLMSLPPLAGLLTTMMLFSGLLELNLITTHYHGSTCEERFPMLESPWVLGLVLGASALALLTICGKCLAHMHHAKRLKVHLNLLGENHGHWCLLPNQEFLVFTLGWLDNTIFITDGLLKQCRERDIEIILAHEQAHALRKDNLRILASRLLLLIVPAASTRRMCDDLLLFIEAACDLVTARTHGALEVAETLLRIQRLVPDRFSYDSRTLVSAFTGSEVEARILLLVEEGRGTKPKPGAWLPVVYVLLLLATTLMLVDPMHHGMEWLLRDN